MVNNKVWFITGAGRGMGTEIAKAALAAGNKVVATGRNIEQVTAVLGKDENLLVVKLDITHSDEAWRQSKKLLKSSGELMYWSTMPQTSMVGSLRN